MLIEKIYKEIYSKMQEDTGADDLAMSDRVICASGDND